MAYYDYNANDVRAQAGQLALQMMDLADRIEQWQAWVTVNQANLEAAGLTKTIEGTPEVTVIRNAADHMAEVIAGFRGTVALTQGDRQPWVKRLLGPATY